jgi:hypothetical protein
MSADYVCALLAASGISAVPLLDQEPEVPKEVLQDIAKLTGVDDDHYREMCDHIQFAIETTCWADNDRKVITALSRSAQSLRPVMRAASTLRDALAKLDWSARTALRAHLISIHPVGWDEEEDRPIEDDQLRNLEVYQRLMADLAQASTAAVGFQLMRRRRGGPRGRRDYVLELLVIRLQLAFSIAGARHLTYDRPTKGGSLVSVLDLLRDYVDFIPNPLPWRALEEMNRHALRTTYQNNPKIIQK